MKQDEAFTEQVIAWLRSVRPDALRCHVCDGDQWTVSPPVEVPTRQWLYLLVMLICNTCGHAVFFDTEHIGVMG